MFYKDELYNKGEITMSKGQQEYRHPAYDDSFRTVETECDDAEARRIRTS